MQMATHNKRQKPKVGTMVLEDIVLVFIKYLMGRKVYKVVEVKIFLGVT